MARVFLSYSRSDEVFATRLRERLQGEVPDVSLWQDRLRMEGGIGWWQQIREALDSVDFMVLVMSQASVLSETVQKEWRYARQQGVSVYPVKAAAFDFAALPRWMSSTHFFDLEKEWPTFVQYLRSPVEARRVPFMAPELPANFVERKAEFAQLRASLLEPGRQNAVAITTALHGAGGFGKTTLAAALCHDEDVITVFFDGVLWVTLGRNPNLQAAVTGLHNALTGGHAAFSDIQTAGVALSEQLQDRTCLIVIDDVWDASHLQPFLRGGKNCARLITTRMFPIAADFTKVNVDEMHGSEAANLLARALPAAKAQIFEETARRLGEWPLLLELANATLRHRVARGDTVEGALRYLNRALDRRGVTGFD
ncbi:MAG TPA: TIR domain-containing protein, partial [Bryobacteraceae bacterium]